MADIEQTYIDEAVRKLHADRLRGAQIDRAAGFPIGTAMAVQKRLGLALERPFHDHQELRRIYNELQSVVDVARYYHASTSSIYRELELAGIDPVRAASAAAILAAYNETQSFNATCRVTRAGRRRVRKILDEAGIPRRPIIAIPASGEPVRQIVYATQLRELQFRDPACEAKYEPFEGLLLDIPPDVLADYRRLQEARHRFTKSMEQLLNRARESNMQPRKFGQAQK